MLHISCAYDDEMILVVVDVYWAHSPFMIQIYFLSLHFGYGSNIIFAHVLHKYLMLMIGCCL